MRSKVALLVTSLDVILLLIEFRVRPLYYTTAQISESEFFKKINEKRHVQFVNMAFTFV